VTLPEFRVSFTEECKQKLELLASPEAMSEALATVLKDRENMPYELGVTRIEQEDGTRIVIRFVKTELYVSEYGVIQPLTLFFGISESRKLVLVLDVLSASGFGLDPGSP